MNRHYIYTTNIYNMIIYRVQKPYFFGEDKQPSKFPEENARHIGVHRAGPRCVACASYIKKF